MGLLVREEHQVLVERGKERHVERVSLMELNVQLCTGMEIVIYGHLPHFPVRTASSMLTQEERSYRKKTRWRRRIVQNPGGNTF